MVTEKLIPNESRSLNNLFYPASFVKHPDIDHFEMVEKLFPLMEPRILNFTEYLIYYQETYRILCQDFDAYLEWREEQFWKELKNKNKRNHK